MQSWIELRTAYQVAKLGTVSAAAEALGVHRATVNRHIDALEADLGTKLFQRHGRGYVLTESGEELLRVTQRADEMFSDFVGRTRAGEEISGELILTAHSGLAGLLMRPVITFRKQHPNTHITLIAKDALVKLEYGEAHVALYGGLKPEHDDYVVQPFEGLRFGLYAHTDYVARNGIPSSPEEFDKHDFVAHPAPAANINFEVWFQENVPKDRIVLMSSHPRVTHEAIVGGVAIGFLPEPYARDRVELHEVIAPRDDWTAAIWLVTHVDLHHTKKVQTMLRCIKQEHARTASEGNG